MTKQKLSVTIDEELVEKLDKERGSFSRSAFLNEILRKRYEE